MVAIAGLTNHLDVMWELPEYAAFLDRLGSFRRVIMFDKRGTGMSDRVPGVPAVEQHVQDVGSTEHAERLGDRRWSYLLQEHHAHVRRALGRFHGTEVDTAGDGFFATFDGPARAIRCACVIRESLRELGIAIRAGLHTGEVERSGQAVSGLAVHVRARVAALADASEVLVTSTVQMLVLGSGITFADRGEHTLKGVPGSWHLFAVETA